MSESKIKTIKIFKGFHTDALEIDVNQFLDEIEDKDPKMHMSYNDNCVAVMIEYYI